MMPEELEQLEMERDELSAEVGHLEDEVERLSARNLELARWVDDLQARTYINCVYCGYRYGPGSEVPASMAEILKQHVEQCPDHPMSKLKQELDQLKALLKELGAQDVRCTCGSGGHPRSCDRHPWGREKHGMELNLIQWEEENEELREILREVVQWADNRLAWPAWLHEKAHAVLEVDDG